MFGNLTFFQKKNMISQFLPLFLTLHNLTCYQFLYNNRMSQTSCPQTEFFSERLVSSVLIAILISAGK